MSADPLLDKMDALLKKHRVVDAPIAPVAQAEFAPPPLPEDAWLPVLTDVVDMGEVGAMHAFPEANAAQTTAPQAAASIDPDALMQELEPRLSALIQGAVAERVRAGLDDALAGLLAELDVHVREIVRETINEKLGK